MKRDVPAIFHKARLPAKWHLGAACVLFSLSLAPLRAQNTAPDPAPLAAARATFLRQVLADSQTLTDQYERALARLEQELATAGDYEEALLVQRRRSELRTLYPGSDPTLAQSLATPLRTLDARTAGTTELRGDLLTGWRTAGSLAEWRNLRLTPGRYHLEFEVNMVQVPMLSGGNVSERAQPQDRVAFDFYEVSLLPGAAENRRSFEVPVSADDASFASQGIGPLNITRSPVTLRLAVAAGYPSNVVRFRNLRLVPVTDLTPLPSSSAPPVLAAETWRQTLAADLAKAQKPVIDQFIKDLQNLAAQTPALHNLVEAEIRRARSALKKSGAGGTLLPRILPAMSGMSGFEDLDGARFIADAANVGDQFWIEHEGKRLLIHLLWVHCAPVEGKPSSSAARSFARHFNIDEADAPAMGELAREFTAGYLQGRPLRVLVRSAKEPGAAQQALVFLPQVGLFQKVLVDQGLAAVQPPPQEVRRGMMESTLLTSLQQSEEAARRRSPPVGAWALGIPSRKEGRP